MCDDLLECDSCGEVYSDCECRDEFDDENVVDTFRPMNAFARARWLRAQEKI